jgi:hypothetical protein
MEDFIVFFVNKNGLNDFVVIKALDLKDAMRTSRLFSKASNCEILGVCRDCFKSFKLDQYE